MPVDKTRELVSLNECGAEPSANSFLPPPSTTGTVKMVIASTRSSARSAWTSSVLPWVTRLGRLLPQALDVGDVAQEHRALPARIDPARARNLGRSTGRLHDAIHGNLGADDDFPHVSSSHRHDASSAFAGGSLERSLAGGRTARRRRLCPRLRPTPMLPKRWSAGSRSDR